MRNLNISVKIYIYVQPQFPLNIPRRHKSITVQEDKPSLRVTSGDVRSALLREQSDFAKFKVPSGQEITIFHEIQSSHVESM